MTNQEKTQFTQEIIDKCRIDKKDEFSLAKHDTAWKGPKGLKKLSKKNIKKKALQILESNLDELGAAQELLYASNKFSVLLIFQAMDAAGKDGTIKHVMSGINPHGCRVFSFKQPSAEELDHNYLWRYSKRLPEFGRIGIFNRSYYEEVLVVKVNPEFLQSGSFNQEPDDAFWNGRYEDINNFEKHLSRNGTLILKFFLNLSKDEQKNRFVERLNDPEKHWKISESDLIERQKWDKYQQAFEDVIGATSTSWAPWHVIPADNKWVMRTFVSTIITESILALNLEPPVLTDEKLQYLGEARKQLENE